MARSPVKRKSTGFSLVEVVIAVAVAGAVLAGIFVPLQTQLHNRKLDETQRLLDQARDALLRYAAVHGRFPCPSDATSLGTEPAVGVNQSTGVCPSYHGFLPAALIGLSPLEQGYAIDAWGSASNRVRYAISSETLSGVAAPFTRIKGMSAVGVAQIGRATNLLHVCGSGNGVVAGANCGTAQTLASNVVLIVWSVGANGPSGGTGVHEAENPNPNGGSADRVFVSRPHSTTSGAEFDDMLVWVSAPLVVSRLITAGELP